MYKEPLSIINSVCPPPTAVAPDNLVAYRFIHTLPAEDGSFASHAALDKTRPLDKDECTWHSCSLFDRLETIETIFKLPKTRVLNKGIAKVILNSDSGLVKYGNNGHIDWWRFANYDVVSNLTIVRTY